MTTAAKTKAEERGTRCSATRYAARYRALEDEGENGCEQMRERAALVVALYEHLQWKEIGEDP